MFSLLKIMRYSNIPTQEKNNMQSRNTTKILMMTQMAISLVQFYCHHLERKDNVVFMKMPCITNAHTIMQITGSNENKSAIIINSCYCQCMHNLHHTILSRYIH